MSRPKALLVAAMGVGFLASAAAASASREDTFTVLRASASQILALELTGTAGANQLAVSGGPAGELILTSRAPVPSPGAPCTQDTPNQVTCPPGYASVLRVIALGGNDEVVLAPGTPLQMDFRGGGGNDFAAGADLLDRLSGGGGADRLQARGGDDEVNGGGGKDHLTGGLGKDLLRGGAGRDRLFGGPSRDQLNGGAGGSDLCNGGPGGDLFKIGTCEAGGE